MKDEIDTVLRAIKNRKAAGVNEIHYEVWKTRKFDDMFGNIVYNQNTIEKCMKGWILPLRVKVDDGIPKNYRGITLIAITAKIYYGLLPMVFNQRL